MDHTIFSVVILFVATCIYLYRDHSVYKMVLNQLKLIDTEIKLATKKATEAEESASRLRSTIMTHKTEIDLMQEHFAKLRESLVVMRKHYAKLNMKMIPTRIEWKEIKNESKQSSKKTRV